MALHANVARNNNNHFISINTLILATKYCIFVCAVKLKPQALINHSGYSADDRR